MIPYQEKKIRNAICFFAREHRAKTRKPLYQTFLYKYLAFFDFISLRETGIPALGLRYQAMPRGPVPIDIYNIRDKCAEFTKDEIGYFVASRGKADLDYFSRYEINLMKRLIEIYAKSYIPAQLISDASHENIKAWKRTWNKSPNSIIDYSLEFEGLLTKKEDDELTCPEEIHLIQKALAH